MVEEEREEGGMVVEEAIRINSINISSSSTKVGPHEEEEEEEEGVVGVPLPLTLLLLLLSNRLHRLRRGVHVLQGGGPAYRGWGPAAPASPVPSSAPTPVHSQRPAGPRPGMDP